MVIKKKSVVAKKPAPRKAAVKKAAPKKTAVKKKAVQKPAAKKTPAAKVKKPVKKKAAKKSSVKKKASPLTTQQAMLRAKRLADRTRDAGDYAGGPSFSAQRGHPTAVSEAHNPVAHLPGHQDHDERARIDQVMTKGMHAHMSSQGRRHQGRRDGR